MSDSAPLRADEVVVGCVTENNPKYLGQTLRLLQSIRWFGGELAQSRVVVGAVEQIDPRARRAFEALAAEVRIVPQFDARNPPGNRLQVFEELYPSAEENFLVLDCDTIVVRDPLPLLRRDAFQAKVAPLATVTHDVFERLFAHFGLPLPERTYVTGYTGVPTIPYFNSGVCLIPKHLTPQFVREWRRFNALLAANQELVAPCQRHLHQASLALALAASGIPTATLGAELNFQLNMTQFPTPPEYLEIDPYIIHYHQLVDDDGMLLPTLFPKSQTRIDAFHDRLRDERSRAIRVHRREPSAQVSPKQIAVLGMHRSGTSIVARLLNAMGCYAGEAHEMPAGDVFNPTGYWEHRDVWALDEDILAALDASWLDPARADLSRIGDAARKTFVSRARGVASALDPHGSWMVKDPRLSILFPIWRDALDRPICVLVWRNPPAVARSLATRDDLPHVVALALWEEYTRTMLASTIGLPRVLVSYDDLIADPFGCALRLHQALVAAGADLLLPAADELREMIDPALDRHSGGGDDILNRPQSELRDALATGAALQWEMVAPIRPETRDLLSRYNRRSGEISRLRTGARDLELLLEATFASRSWRLGFGLTRALRMLFPSHKETAADRWKRRRPVS
jgi:hypothetical protein